MQAVAIVSYFVMAVSFSGDCLFHKQLSTFTFAKQATYLNSKSEWEHAHSGHGSSSFYGSKLRR
jgi:hypothetical protein